MRKQANGYQGGKGVGVNWKPGTDIYTPLYMKQGFSGGSGGKESTAIQETLVQFLGQKDPLQKEMATHSSILASEIPWTEATVHGVTRV